MAHPMPASTDAEASSDRERFVNRLDVILHKLRSVARRRCMQPDEEDEFVSWALLRMIESDYSVVRDWRGDARFRNYLDVVVSRLLLDFRNHRWGKFRISKTARHLGRSAELLDLFIHRDGLSTAEAIEMVARNHRTRVDRKRLHEVAERLPSRQTRRMQCLDDVPAQAVDGRVERSVRRRERALLCRELERELDDALSGMDADDLRILVLRYVCGCTADEIGGELDLTRRRVYQRIETILARLRRHLCGRGFEASDLLDLVAAEGVELRLRRLQPAEQLEAA